MKKNQNIPKPIDNEEYQTDNNSKKENNEIFEKELKKINDYNNDIQKNLNEEEENEEFLKKKEEEDKKKKEEQEKKKQEEKNKIFNEYNEKRIEIKDIFMPAIKYEKENFYDVIIKINLLNELLIDGWEICYSKENYEQNKDKLLIPISVIGESNRGKSYLLGRICNIDLPAGFNEKTEGISVKYLLIDKYNCALIDSAGGQTPIVKDDKNNLYFKKFLKDILINEEEKKLDEKKDNKREIEKKIEEIKKTDYDLKEIKTKNENLFDRCLKKIISDKTITEQFIKDFVLNKSRIIIIVVGQLTISEQLLINNIKEINRNNNETEEIIIIHNLLNFVKKKQVEDYINDVLKKSIYFNLEERNITEIDNVINQDVNKKYFIERYENEVNKKSIVIRHLIYANDSKESEAGNYYNYSSINYLRNIIVAISNQRAFDIIKELKDFLIHDSFEYIELNEEQKKKDKKVDKIITPFTEKNIIIEEKIENNEIQNEQNEDNKEQKNQKKTYLMKIIDIPNLRLKKLQTDESGNFKYLGNAFIPNYSYYTELVDKNTLKKIDKNNKLNINDQMEVLIIAIELAGKIKDFRPKINTRNGKYYIIISGEKELPKVNDIVYYSDIEENEFRIEFEINMDEIELQSNKLLKNATKDGIVKLYYEIKSKSKKKEGELEKITVNPVKKENEKKDEKKKKKKNNDNENKKDNQNEKKK